MSARNSLIKRRDCNKMPEAATLVVETKAPIEKQPDGIRQWGQWGQVPRVQRSTSLGTHSQKNLEVEEASGQGSPQRRPPRVQPGVLLPRYLPYGPEIPPPDV